MKLDLGMHIGWHLVFFGKNRCDMRREFLAKGGAGSWGRPAMGGASLLTVKIRQPSHEFTFGVGIGFINYPLVLIHVV
jgi:hypothetical protein